VNEQNVGGGKTTLGKAFPGQLREKHVQTFFEDKLKLENNKDLWSEWDVLVKDQIKHVVIDVRSEPNVVEEAVRVVTGTDDIELRGSGLMAAKHLIDYAQANGPTLFHFDEVGADLDSIYELREFAVAVWMLQSEIRNKGEGNMPRIYFLVTGSCMAPFEDLYRMDLAGRVNSRFLFLSMLSPAHIGAVRLHLQDKAKVGLPLELQGLRGEDSGHLDACLARATGGAPRLLLHTLRALHYLRTPLGSREEIDTAVFETVFTSLRSIGAVSKDFFPSGSDTRTLKTFALLLMFYMQKDKLTAMQSVQFENEVVPLHRLLRFQPFFLSRGQHDGFSAYDSAFTLCLPGYHFRAVDEFFGQNAVVMHVIIAANRHIFELS
jgi:hypothetical protein